MRRSPAPPSGGIDRARSAPTSSPAWTSQPLTVSVRNPSRRWACSVRRNSSECGREVDDQQPPARRQQPRRLADGARRIVEEVQHLVDDDEVERAVLERRAVDVALAQVDAAHFRPLEIGAGDGEHRVAVVDADRPIDAVVAPAAAACARCRCRGRAPIGRAVRRRRSRIAAFDDRVGSVQRALLVPVVGDAGEVLLGGGGAAAAHHLEPVEVDRRAGVVVLDARTSRSATSSAIGPSPTSSKNAHVPSRCLSTTPASASSLRWREMRGWDWPRMSVRSVTVSSPCCSRATIRSRVSSPTRAQHVEDGLGAECHPATI